MADPKPVVINATSVPPLQEVYHPKYLEHFETWVKMDDLFAGQTRIKKKREVYLPPTSLELQETGGLSSSVNVGTTMLPDVTATTVFRAKKTKYEQRLDRAVFFNGVSRHTRYAIGHIFREKPQIRLPENDFADFMADSDLLGTDLVQFVKNVSTRSYVMGHYFVLVDFPKTEGQITSLREQREAGLRPYLVAISPLNIINWRISQDKGGRYRFDFVVYKYEESMNGAPFSAPDRRTRYKIWYPDRWELWEIQSISAAGSRTKKAERVLVESGTNGLGYVPLFPVYTNAIGPMESMPPLLEAADLNLAHYQGYSFFNNGLLYHLNPLLTVIGAKTDQVQLNPAIALTLPKDAEAKYVEFTGGALDIAKGATQQIANEMWEAGLRNTSFLGANTSAEARRVARSDFTSWLESVSNAYDAGWDEILRAAADWKGVEVPNDKPLIRFNKDFDVSILESSLAEFLLRLRAGGEISKKTLLLELQRGEVISKSIDIDKEMEEAQNDLTEDLKLAAKFETEPAGASVANPPEQSVQGGGRTPKSSTRGNGSRTPRRRGASAAATTA